jgi:hypothetical protein
MRYFKAAVLILLLVPTLGVAQKKAKKPNVPEAFENAHLVFVQAMEGEEFDRDLDPAERIAIADVRDALKAWGRYTITSERDKADLVFVVRKGRLANGAMSGGLQDPQGGAGGGRFPGSQRQQGPFGQQGTGIGGGGEQAQPEDLLEVCQVNPKGKLGSPLWQRSIAYGLSAPRLMLFAELKNEVEKAYPYTPPPSTPARR